MSLASIQDLPPDWDEKQVGECFDLAAAPTALGGDFLLLTLKGVQELESAFITDAALPPISSGRHLSLLIREVGEVAILDPGYATCLFRSRSVMARVSTCVRPGPDGAPALDAAALAEIRLPVPRVLDTQVQLGSRILSIDREAEATLTLARSLATKAGSVLDTALAEVFHSDRSSRWSGDKPLADLATPVPTAAGGDTVMFPAGSILYRIAAPSERHARVAAQGGTCPPDLLPLRAVAGGALPEFLAWVMRTNRFALYVAQRISGGGTSAQMWQRISRFGIRFPSADEQQRLVTYLNGVQDEAEAMVALGARVVSGLQQVRAGLLDEAIGRFAPHGTV